MCGRYTLTDIQKALTQKNVAADAVLEDFDGQYNIAPTQHVPVILNADPTKAVLARWGLIPRWSKDADIGNRMINARAETVAEKPSFKPLLKNRRCLVLADGFYEWKKAGSTKIPYRLTLKSGEVFSFAGLWDTWTDPGTQEAVLTFTIITTTANSLVQDIHERMPVMLTAAAEKTWLKADLAPAEALALLKPFPAHLMQAKEVSLRVNSPANNSPDILMPVGTPKLIRRPRP